MSDLQKITENVVLEFFSKDKIDNIICSEDKIIVTLKNADEKNQTELENKIKEKTKINKVFIIFTREKNVQSIGKNNDKWQVRNVKKIIAVASGKGGVGKSTTAVNLAVALSGLGLKTAIFDADIYGPSLPTMLGYEGVGAHSYDGINFEPFKYNNLESMSIGTLIEKDTPLIWRGAKACGAIEQLITQTNWSETDVMVIDMPPGTGDIQISIAQKLNIDGVVIVSTPQDVALVDAVKGINMFKSLDISIIGIIENMSYYICEHCGEKSYIFGHNGVKNAAEKMGEQFLGEIPLNTRIRENADKGTPVTANKTEQETAKVYYDIAQKIKDSILA